MLRHFSVTFAICRKTTIFAIRNCVALTKVSMNRLFIILSTLLALLSSCSGKRQGEAVQSSEGFDITGVWKLIDKHYPEGYSYAYSLESWAQAMMFDSDGTFFHFNIHEVGGEVFVTPYTEGRYSLTPTTIYIANYRALPFRVINDTTMTTVWNYCTETWRKVTDMTEARKEEIRNIFHNARRTEEGYVINDWIHSTSQRQLESTIDKYRNVITVLGIVVAFIILYAIEVTRRKRRAEQNLAAIKEELSMRPALVTDAIRQVENIFFQSDYYQALRPRLVAGENMTDEDWREMEQQINSVYTGFSRKLRSLYDFSDVEFQVCLLIKLGVSNNDIAAVINRAPNSVSSIRGRLHKKVLGPDGGAKEWDDFVLSL